MATATYRQNKCKWVRREGQILTNIKSGVRPLDSKCQVEVPPGMHGRRLGRARLSDYGLQLRQKQMIRRIYGVLEKQFRNYYKAAARKSGSTAENLLQLLESRLDNVVYRMGFASTTAEARQLVSHKAILVNGTVVNIPSYHVLPNDVVEIREKAKKQLRIKAAVELAQQGVIPEWIDVDANTYKGIYKYAPQVSDMPSWYNLNLIIELYSK